MASKFWSNSPLSDDEEEVRREEREQWHEEGYPYRSYSYARAAPRFKPADNGNPAFFEGAFTPKTAKQEKQAKKADAKRRKEDAKRRRREADQEAEKEKERLKNMDRWEYLKMWQVRDRAAHGAAFDEFATSATDFIKDNTKEFPRLKKHGCKRLGCVRGEMLGVCHHEVEATLRGSGCLDEKMIKKERLRWHPDRWTGKGELQKKSNELFQLIQRIIDGDVCK